VDDAVRLVSVVLGETGQRHPVSILWVVLIVILVLGVLGFFSRGAW
jgi:hypothetical protein